MNLKIDWNAPVGSGKRARGAPETFAARPAPHPYTRQAFRCTPERLSGVRLRRPRVYTCKALGPTPANGRSRTPTEEAQASMV